MSAELKTLRDRTATSAEFRRAAHAVSHDTLDKTKKLTEDRGMDPKRIVIVVILRAGLAFLDAAMAAFPEAPVGVLGLKRDERTLKPRLYYENLPMISTEHTVFLCDPMLATGGSAEAAVEVLKSRGADSGKIYFTGIVAAPEGLSRLTKLIPKENIVLAAVDEKLDEQGMIVPGVGDFGDRYFGYAGKAIIGG